MRQSRLLSSVIVQKRFVLLVWCVSWALAGLFLFYYGVGVHSLQRGEQLVLAEWPGPAFSPVSLKPIAWVCTLAFLGFAFGLDTLEPLLTRFPSGVARLFFILSAFSALGSFYEVMFNFSLWGALMSTSALSVGPDFLASNYPPERGLINIVFAAYTVTTLFAASLYLTAFMQALVERQGRRPLKRVETV